MEEIPAASRAAPQHRALGSSLVPAEHRGEWKLSLLISLLCLKVGEGKLPALQHRQLSGIDLIRSVRKVELECFTNL